MPKYAVYGAVFASFTAGIYEAASEKEAIKMAQNETYPPSVCHQCSNEVEIGELDEHGFYAEEETEE
jgi:hypothetical protein